MGPFYCCIHTERLFVYNSSIKYEGVIQYGNT
jgi:hypothetical protein